MPVCSITQITEPTSLSVYDAGDTVDISWNINSIPLCSNWNVINIKLYEGASYHSTLWTGTTDLDVYEQSVTLPSSNLTFGDIYTFQLEYEEIEF